MSGTESSKEYAPVIQKVSIDNFKGISHCEIKDIGQVNLFIGRNGCGKSSIMEAIYFTGKEFLDTNLPQCIQRRAKRGNWSASELWYNYLVDSDVNVRLSLNEQYFTGMNVRYLPKGDIAYVTVNCGSPELGERQTTNQYYVSGFRVASRATSSALHHEQIRHYFDESVLVDPTIKTDITQIERNYLNIMRLSEESSSELAKRTSEIYETEPSWEFLPHPVLRDNRFAILERKRRLFLDNFGDGLHYGLAVMSIAKTRKNTALFIEEIESHQHPEAIRNLISNLLDIARTNNLQLFITTHNQSVFNYLFYNYKSPEERRKELRCFLVTRDKDSGKVEATIQEGIANIQPDLHGTP